MFFGTHNHTEYSNLRLIDSTNKIPDLITYAHSLGHKGIAITDHETVTSALPTELFFDTVKDKPEWHDFKVALGNEIYLCSERTCKENTGMPEYMVFPHFILIAKDAIGHEQLRELSTRAWLRAFMYKGLIRVPTYVQDLEEVIGANKGHVIGQSACIGGSIPRIILRWYHGKNGGFDKSEEYQQCIQWIEALKDIFGEDNFFLELQPSFNEEQIAVNRSLVLLSGVTDTPYVISTDAHYLNKGEAKLHETFLKSRDGDREVTEFYASTYVMSEEEIHEYMDESLGQDTVQKGIDNTMLIYDMIESYSLKKPLRIPYLPLDHREPDKTLYEKYVIHIPLLKEFYEAQDECDRHLVRAITESLEQHEEYREQAMYDHLGVCLDTIWVSSEKMNTRWSAYLLNMADYIKVIWEKGDSLVGCGRGSGVGFGLLNVLGITQINPLKMPVTTYTWRFLNPERVSVLDVDTDIEGAKRESVMQAFYDTYGRDRVSKVLTYNTEGSRSAILSMARGLGIDNDIASYIASLIVADRGTTRSLKTMYYGDEDVKPVPEFVKAMNEYPELWEGAQKIEGLISGNGSHAGGVIFVDEPFTKTTALMRTSTGDIVTQCSLHEAEAMSLIKIDLLSIEALDKIRAELNLLLADGRIEWKGTLKDTYESVIGINVIDMTSPEIWELIQKHKIMSLFQFEKQSGWQAIELGKPKCLEDMAALNSVMRLMAPEGGGEAPLERWARFSKDISLWYKEMDDYGLTKEEQQWVAKYAEKTNGMLPNQENFMLIVQDEKVGGFSLLWADKLRKAVA